MSQFTIKEQVANILAAHSAWIETDGKLGVQLDLSSADLQGANLNGANLSEADLAYADLSRSNLNHAAFYYAILQNAELCATNLRGANFTDADLTEAKLNGVDFIESKFTAAPPILQMPFGVASEREQLIERINELESINTEGVKAAAEAGLAAAQKHVKNTVSRQTLLKIIEECDDRILMLEESAQTALDASIETSIYAAQELRSALGELEKVDDYCDQLEKYIPKKRLKKMLADCGTPWDLPSKFTGFPPLDATSQEDLQSIKGQGADHKTKTSAVSDTATLDAIEKLRSQRDSLRITADNLDEHCAHLEESLEKSHAREASLADENIGIVAQAAEAAIDTAKELQKAVSALGKLNDYCAQLEKYMSKKRLKKMKKKCGEFWDGEPVQLKKTSSAACLQVVLDAHKEWLASEGKTGTQFDLRDADLKGAFLSGADPTGAYLNNACLYEANLRAANLIRANLAEANLEGAGLTDAKLARANLTDADLTGVKGTDSDQTIINKRIYAKRLDERLAKDPEFKTEYEQAESLKKLEDKDRDD